jgi:hypothetical protein
VACFVFVQDNDNDSDKKKDNNNNNNKVILNAEKSQLHVALVTRATGQRSAPVQFAAVCCQAWRWRVTGCHVLSAPSL